MNVPRLASLVVLLCAATTAFAQEPLTKAKALYDAANYEEALTVLARAEEPEAQQYKALCMLALGRPQDATGAVELLISSTPTFEPSSEDVPPRFMSLVSDTKKKLLPGIARKTFNEAREQFKTGDREAALKKFDLVVQLASNAGFKDTPEAEDLRTLASGFIELAAATAKPEPKTSVPAPEAPKLAEAAPVAAPPPSPVAAPSRATAAATTTPASEVTQPVAIRQPIPPIPSGISGLGSPTASVKVEIGVDGRVNHAFMQHPSHPLYDRLVLQAAREWLYTPAMLNGRPVPSEKVVTIQLR
jgi:tetratricopeptide (TPR) repeat protein